MSMGPASEMPERRSAGSLSQRRVQQAWPPDREFKILSIDGGGIKGIFPATLLAEMEERYLEGRSIADHFDLITGTSTGGIIALALSIGMPAREIANLYIERGNNIFPPYAPSWRGWLSRKWDSARGMVYHRYDRAALMAMLDETFGERLLGESKSRLCIPSCDGRHGDVYIFKTPHHPDYKRDQHERMITVAAATAAAPTFFQPLESGGYRFVDGGLWANNPIMVGLVDALACFDIDRHNVRILSLGCGDEPYTVSDRMMQRGGLWSWRTVINGALSFQSLNTLGQAKLLIGAERVMRVVPPQLTPPIALDDWTRAKEHLPGSARDIAIKQGGQIKKLFL
jgi:uncharacterized protein